jgi:hypothetical protein
MAVVAIGLPVLMIRTYLSKVRAPLVFRQVTSMAPPPPSPSPLPFPKIIIDPTLA